MRVIRTEEDGREILLYYIKAGESCIMSFLGGLHNETSKVKVEIEDDAEILFLPVDKVSLFMKEHPEWLNYIFRSYHKRFEELLDTVNAIAFKKMDERLLALIQKKAELVEGNTIQITHEGEKAQMNGMLNFSVKDGWWYEGYTEEAGWALTEVQTYENTQYQDHLDAATIYTMLENEIVPLFFDRNKEGIPEKWVSATTPAS